VAVGAAESGQASPGRRALLTALVVLVVVALVGGGVAYLITSGPGPVPRISPAAQRLLRSSLAAAGKKGSFHYVLHSSSQGVSETTVGDAAPTSGKQVITIGPDTFTVLVIGRACYFQGDAREMVDQLGLSVATATAHAGQWISLAPSDAPYQSVYAAVTAHAALADNIDFAPHRRLPASVVSGHRVIGVSGPLTNFTVAGQTQKAKGTAYLYGGVQAPRAPGVHRAGDHRRTEEHVHDGLRPLGRARHGERPPGCDAVLLGGIGHHHPVGNPVARVHLTPPGTAARPQAVRR
jgi:hypothetical protein